jgi:hypothetical protein
VFLEASLLVFGVVDDVEDVGEATLVGLPAEHEEDKDGEECDGGLEVLPGGELDELVLDLDEEVVLLPHAGYHYYYAQIHHRIQSCMKGR